VMVTVTDNDDGPTFGSQVASQAYTEGTAIPTLTLPAATGGAGMPTYALTGLPDADALGLPGGLGLTYSASDRTLTGTPATFASFTLTWTATDDNMISASQTFDVLVRALVTVGFEHTSFTQSEDVGQFQVCVVVTSPLSSDPLESTFSLSVSTRQGSADNSDYTAVTNQAVGPFSNSRRQECFLVEVSDDANPEDQENFFLDLGPPPGTNLSETIITPSQAGVNIEDDDTITVRWVQDSRAVSGRCGGAAVEKHFAREPAAHGVRGGVVPQPRRVFRQRHRHFHGHGRHLHAALSVLRCGARPAAAAGRG